MKRLRVVGASVGGREVDGDGASEVGAALNVVEEGERFPDLVVDQHHRAGVLVLGFFLLK